MAGGCAPRAGEGVARLALEAEFLISLQAVLQNLPREFD